MALAREVACALQLYGLGPDPNRKPPDLSETAQIRAHARAATSQQIVSRPIRAHAHARGWGGARNRADRTSFYLSESQARMLLAAHEMALRLGLEPNVHWTVHYECAGIPDEEGTAFVGRILADARNYARRRGLPFAAYWVRENGQGKGAHIHIAMHWPRGLSLRGLTSRWIKNAGGTCMKGTSVVRRIGGLAHYQRGKWFDANAHELTLYMLKGVADALGEELGLRPSRRGKGGNIVGKRAGRTQNLC